MPQEPNFQLSSFLGVCYRRDTNLRTTACDGFYLQRIRNILKVFCSKYVKSACLRKMKIGRVLGSRISLKFLQLIFQISSSTNPKKKSIFFHYNFFYFTILGFAIFEQTDTFFKKSLKILRINFFQIRKKRFVRYYLYFKKTNRNCEIGIPEYLFSVLPIFFYFYHFELSKGPRYPKSVFPVLKCEIMFVLNNKVHFGGLKYWQP
jgi:hypothetical protein